MTDDPCFFQELWIGFSQHHDIIKIGVPIKSVSRSQHVQATHTKNLELELRLGPNYVCFLSSSLAQRICISFRLNLGYPIPVKRIEKEKKTILLWA